ncbi:MAG: oligosaccharide flippase family protein [Ruminococcus sp.]|nr:oligosaccharide flippase family protein [Ruminococcus sp.]
MVKIQKNIIYQAIYQVVVALTPLITSPYISRVLGVKNLGIYSYTYAMVSYFMLFSMLGITNYGSREIAISCIRGKECRDRTFGEIFPIQFFMTVIMIGLYILYFILAVRENRIVVAIQMINIISCLFDVNWFFVGIEKIKVIVIRGIVVKFITVFCILFFVKSENDLWIYVVIMSVSTLINNLILWIYIFSDLELIIPSLKDVLKHIKPCFILFLPVLSSSVYRIMDKTMVGRLSDYEQLGFYYNADKVINIPICLVSGISMILLPRMTRYIHNNEIEKANMLFSQSIDIFLGLSCAVGFGIASVAKEFIPFFFGSNYYECVLLVIIFSPAFIIKSMSMCIRYVYLIPNKQEKIYNFAILGGVVVNLILNFWWIPYYGAKGAVCATLLTELTVCIIQISGIEKSVRRSIIRKQLLYYFVNATIMCILIYYVEYLDCANSVKLLLKIFFGIGIYLGLCLWEWGHSRDKIFMQYISSIIMLLRKINI